MRIYSNYSNDEFDEIKTQAKKVGMTTSSFQKYCIMLYIKSEIATRNNAVTLPTLISDMMTALSNLKTNDVFIISSLFAPEIWANLSTSEKRTLSSNLSSYVKANSSLFIFVDNKRGKINRYKKL